jgi:lipopolysaccharide transport system ATP-binding protein
MSEVVIEVHELSKLYRLGVIGTGSFRQDLKHWWTSSVLKKPNSFFQLPGASGAPSTESIWALQDISFKLKQGSALGVIGSNGAGKSTLLKIISRIVRPTHGYVRGRGKVGSLLEVGTGFNPELTGRENIFISGYLLGMKKPEIRSKFDEIIAFSGIERFIDTPVKRYSSGMYVRLAFAVAAHLEPDILIVDEVLAVGDADFQKRCLGKMKEVSNAQGRTILFVSHNLTAISGLCSEALWLEGGRMRELGSANNVVNNYISSFKKDSSGKEWQEPEEAPGNESIRLKTISVKPQGGGADAFITVRTPIQMDFDFWCFLEDCSLNVNVILLTENGECVFNLGTASVKARKGVLSLRSTIPGDLLNNTVYSVSLKVIKNNSAAIYEFSHCTNFEVEDVRENMYYFGAWPGVIRPQIHSYLTMKEELVEELDT